MALMTVQATIPIYLGAEGPKNVALSAEIAKRNGATVNVKPAKLGGIGWWAPTAVGTAVARKERIRPLCGRSDRERRCAHTQPRTTQH